MSIPSQAIFYRNTGKVEEVHSQSVNCGWLLDEYSAYNAIRFSIDRMPVEVEWEHVTAYGYLWSYAEICSDSFQESMKQKRIDENIVHNRKVRKLDVRKSVIRSCPQMLVKKVVNHGNS